MARIGRVLVVALGVGVFVLLVLAAGWIGSHFAV